MKKLILGVFAGVALFAAGVQAAETTTTLKVEGWHCGSCANRTAKTLEKVEGVKAASGDIKERTVTVTYDDEATSLAAIEEAITGLKYTVAK